MVNADSKIYLGLDFGTLSARAIVVRLADGRIMGEASYVYPHGVLTAALPCGLILPEQYALAVPGDYSAALRYCIGKAIEDSGIKREEISGVGISATTYTMVSCDESGTPMCENPKYAAEPMAYIKLWKHHGAAAQAEKMSEIHRQTQGFPVSNRYGYCFNCEWAVPKLLESFEKAPELFNDTARFCDLGEWLSWQLTGEPVLSKYSAGFKGLWAEELGYPDGDVLDMLGSGFAAALREKFMASPCGYERACGYVSKKAAELFGLPEGIPVASPMGDGSAPGVCFGITNPDSISITVGTSIAMAFLSDTLVEMKGINGVVKDGIVPGKYGYDAGQPCAGDMLDWFIKKLLLSDERNQPGKQNIHTYLTDLSMKKGPWKNPLTVLDWWNGNRSVLNNNALRGSIIGLSLTTETEDIYTAMIQGLACGSRRVIDEMKKNGICFDKAILCGGMSRKNPLVREQYANLLGLPVVYAETSQITALSSAMLAAIADGIPVQKAAECLSPSLRTVAPDPEHREEYEEIYRRWCKYHDLLGAEGRQE